MKIVEKLISEIQEYANNPRRNDDAVYFVANSIREFGFRAPIIIDSTNTIIAGHTRLKAAKSLDLKTVPCVVADDLTEEQVRAYRLVDNRVAEMAVWDEPLLSEALDFIGDAFDMIDFGFEEIKDDRNERIETNMEFDEDDFSDEAFEYECPDCGFHFSE